MNITITQPAPYYASLAMTSLVITPAAVRAKKSASPDGAVRTATDHSARMDVCMERAKGQVCVNVATATKEPSVTNVRPIQDAKMASAQNHGSVVATKIGVAFSVTKVSNKS
jgi:hypothetical protein